MQSQWKYWAFISYSHQDNLAEGRHWGDWLHEAVEHFKVPAELAGKAGRNGEAVPERLYPVFQDEKELPTNADLGEAIQAALEQSRYLVVICSPRSARSFYVNQEVLAFKRLGRANRILAIIIDGEPNASDSAKGMDPARECFPPALRHALDAAGNLDLGSRVEPIAADVRATGGGQASLTDKGHQSVLEREKLRVVAGLLGVGFDDLVQRDKERQLREERSRARRLRKLVAGFAGLFVLAVLAGFVALLQKGEADRQRQEALGQKQEAVRQQHVAQQAFSQADCATALERIKNGQAAEAVAFACRALRTNPGNEHAAALLYSILTTLPWVVPVDRFDAVEGESWLAFDANGKYAASRAGARVRIWDLGGHRVVREISEVTFSMVPPVFTPDGRFLILSVGKSLQKVEIASGTRSPVGSGQEQSEAFGEAFRFSPDGRKIALGRDNTVQAWDLADNQTVGDPVKRPANPYDGLPAAVSRDGRYAVASWTGGPVMLWDESGKIVARTFEKLTRGAGDPLRIWDVATGKPLAGGLPYTDTRIHLTAFSPDGGRVVAATMDQTANIYDTLRIWKVGSEEEPVSVAHGVNIVAASWSADGRYILTTAGNVVRLIDAATGKLVLEPLSTPEDVLEAWFTPDGKRIVGAMIQRSGVDLSSEPGLYGYLLNPGGRERMTYYQVKSAFLWDAVAAAPRVATYHLDQWVLDGQFSPDGKMLVTTSGSAAQIWDVARGVRKAEIPLEEVPVCVAFSADSGRLLTVTREEVARVWDVGTGLAVTPAIRDAAEVAYAEEHNNRGVTSIGFAMPAHPDRARYGAFSPDGKRLALTTGFGARIWDAATGKALSSPLHHRDYVRSVCFSPDGSLLLTSGLDAQAILWDVATGKAVGQPMHCKGEIRYSIFSPDGTQVATAASDDTVQVWNVRTGAAVCTIKQASAASFVEFSPDGRCVITLTADGARVFNAATGAAVSPMMRGEAALMSVRSSPDGRHVLTASADKSARIWDATSGLLVTAPVVHGSAVNVAAFSADGSLVVSADEGGTVKVWPFYAGIPQAWVLDVAEAVAGCSLDATGTPSHMPGKTMGKLREEAGRRAESADALNRWARAILQVR